MRFFPRTPRILVLLALAGGLSLHAQTVMTQGVITSLVSSGLFGPLASAVDSYGNVYIADSGHQRIAKVAAVTGTVTTIAGDGTTCSSATTACGDAGAATSANLNTPEGVAVDSYGNIFIADTFDYRIRVVCTVASGTFCSSKTVGDIYTIAGSGNVCNQLTCGDGAAATSAGFNQPMGIATDGLGNVYIADHNNSRIRIVCAVTTGKYCNGGTAGDIYTVAGLAAGPGSECSTNTAACGDGGLATSAQLWSPLAVAVDSSQNVYIGDGNRIREVTASTLDISSIAGNSGVACSTPTASPACGDTSAATSAQFNNVPGLALDSNGNLVVADFGDYRVRVVCQVANGYLCVGKTVGDVYTVAGDGANSGGTLNGPATSASLWYPNGVALDAAGNLYIVNESVSTVDEVSYSSLNFGTVNGASSSATFTAAFSFSGSTTVGSIGVLTQGTTSLDFKAVAGGTCAAQSYSAGGSCTVAVKFSPVAPGLRLGAVVLYDNNSPANALATIYLQGVGSGPAVAFEPGTISVYAGGGSSPGTCAGHTDLVGDGCIATQASLTEPGDVRVDAAGNLYIADLFSYRIRKVFPSGTISTLAGTGTQCSPPTATCGDGGLATTAKLYSGSLGNVSDVAVDGAGNVYIADSFRVRMVTPGGIITTVAGTGTQCPSYTGICGDGGSATSATLLDTDHIAVDGAGNIYLTDGGVRIRKITVATGVINTIAGTGTAGFSGDNGPATSATLDQAIGLALDASGNLYIADYANSRIRKVSTSGIIATVAGGGLSPGTCTGSTNSIGDGCAAASATVAPEALVVDGAGDLYVADTTNGRIRMVNASGIISTVAGTGAFGSTGYGGPATNAELNAPFGVGLDALGNFYIANGSSANVLKVDVSDNPSMAFGSVNIGSSSAAQSVALQNFGNASLLSETGTPISISSGFAQVAGSGTPADCSASGFTLSIGAECNLSIEFSPTTGGSASGNALIHDNAQNYTSAQQQIALSGSGNAAATTLTLVANPTSPGTYGTLVTLTASLSPYSAGSNSTNGETIVFTSGGVNVGSGLLSGGVATTLLSLPVGGYNLQATYATDGSFDAAVSNTVSYTVNQAPQTITFNALSDKFTTDPPFSVSATASSTLPVSFSVYNTTAYGWVTSSATMSPAVNTAVAGAPGDGMIYVAGGAGSGGHTATLQQYNPATQTWTTKASMPTPRYQAAGASIGGILYVAGGWASSIPSSVLEAYNPATNTWASKASMPRLSACGVAGAINGKLYVFTPCNGNSGYFSFLDVYDPVANNWTTLASAPTSHSGGAGGVINGKLYIAGGLNTAGNPTSELDVYDPVAASWSTLASMPAALAGVKGDVIDGKLYVVGGNDASSNYYASVYVYDPVANSWSTYASMPAAFANSAAVAMNGALYIAGGNNSSGNLGALQILNTNACTLSGTTVTLNGSAGICTVAASQTGNSNYTAAATVTQSFNITVSPITKLVYGTSPASTITAGGNGGSAITVLEQNSAGVTQAAGTDAITLTVTGPNSYSQTYGPTNAISGIAIFNTAVNALTTAGTYTYTATFGSLASAAATETVTAAAATHYSVTAQPTATAGASFNASVTALDAYGNTATGYSGIVQFTSTDAAAVLPANSTLTSGTGIFAITLKTAGSKTITATDTVTGTITGTTTAITVNAGAATAFAFTNPSTANAGASFNVTVTALDAFDNTATGYSGTAHFTSTDATAVLPANSTLTSGAGTFSLTLNSAGSKTITATDTVNGSITGTSGAVGVTASPTIAFTVANQTYGVTPFAVAATSNSTGTFTYSVVSGPATIAGATVTLTGAGTVVLQASEVAAGYYTAGTLNVSFTVAAAAPTITFTVANQTYGVAPFAVAATSNSTGAFTYSVVSGPATIAGSTVTLTGAGTVVLQASETAAGNYTAGTQTVSFAVAAAIPSITFTVPNHTFGDAPFTVSASSNSTGALTYSLVSGPATISGSTVSLTGAGTVVLKASQAAAGSYAAGTQTATFTVSTAVPAILFSVPNHTYGDAPFTVTATSNSTGAFVYSVVSGPATIAGSTVTLTGAGSVKLKATEAADTNYSAGSQTATFTVATAAPVIVFAVPNHTFGDAPFTVSASSNSTGAITYSVVSGPATISGSTVTLTGSGAVSLKATQVAAGNYAAGTQTAAFTVAAPIVPTIILTVPGHTFGDAPFTVNATSNSTGTLTYSVVSGSATISGSTVTLTSAGTVTLQASQSASSPYAAATQQASFTVARFTPAISWTTPNSIAYGTGLSGVQLNATVAGVGGTALNGVYTYTPVAGAVLTPATHTLSLLFTPTDAADYTTANASVLLTVTPAALVIAASNATRMYGAANPVFTGTITGQQNGDTFTESFFSTAGPLSSPASYAIVPSATGANLGNYSQIIQTGTLVVTQAGTTATLTVGTQNVLAGQNNTYTATITSLASGTPTGVAQFFDNGLPFASAPLVAGQAVLNSSALAVGAHAITIAYSGDTNFLPNAPTVTANVTVTVPDFTFVLNTASTVSIPVGGAASFTLHLTPQTGTYYQTVYLSYDGALPVNAVAGFSPSTIAVNAGPTDVIFTVATQKIGLLRSPTGIAGQAILCLILLPLAFERRIRKSRSVLSRAALGMLLLLLGAGTTISLTGCGSGYTAGTYPITVVANSGGVTHALTVTVQVQQTPQ